MRRYHGPSRASRATAFLPAGRRLAAQCWAVARRPLCRGQEGGRGGGQETRGGGLGVKVNEERHRGREREGEDDQRDSEGLEGGRRGDADFSR